MTLAILGVSSSAMATKLECTGGDKTLTVISDDLGRVPYAEAILTSPEMKVALYGLKTSHFSYDFSGSGAMLQLAIPTKPGGGCKRCATTDDELFAGFFWGKLDYAGQVLSFKCIPSN
ncbi:hypothetical protein D3C86_1965280 [compost metagenome]